MSNPDHAPRPPRSLWLPPVGITAAVSLTLGLGLGVISFMVLFVRGQEPPLSAGVAVAAVGSLWVLAARMLFSARRVRWRLAGAALLVLAVTGTGVLVPYLVDGYRHVVPAGDAGEVVRLCGVATYFEVDRAALAAIRHDFPGVPARVAVGCRSREVRIRVGPFASTDGATRVVVDERVDVPSGADGGGVTVAPYTSPAPIQALLPRIPRRTASLGAGPRHCLIRSSDCLGLGCEGVPPFEGWCVAAGARRARTCPDGTGCAALRLHLPNP